MKFLKRGRDGGPESTVTGYWLFEIKWLFSIVLLRFADGSRDSFHSHAFNSISWLLRGMLLEVHRDGSSELHAPSLRPIVTTRDTFHRVRSTGTTWVLSFRGPWSKTWREYDPATGDCTTLTNGRVPV